MYIQCSMQAVSLRNCLGRRLDKAEIHFEEEVTDIEQKTSATGKILALS